MSRRRFDHFMLEVEIGGNGKVGRLTDAEFRCWIAGVLPLAAKSPIRGCLLVGDMRVEADDVARQARCGVSVATRTLVKLRQLGMVETDEDLGVERVHDFDLHNPAPKKDATNAERQRRYRERLLRRYPPSRNAVTNAVTNGTETALVTPTEEKRREENPPKPPEGGKVIKFDRKPVPAKRLELATAILEAFNKAAGTDYQPLTGDEKPSEPLKRILGALTRAPDLTFLEADEMIRWQLQRPYWEGKAQPGNVFGEGVFAQVRASAAEDVATYDLDAIAERTEARLGL